MRDRYRSALELYRRRFLPGYVTMFQPPEFEYASKEKIELRKESLKMFSGLIKQKEGRIGINIRQSFLNRKAREDYSLERYIEMA